MHYDRQLQDLAWCAIARSPHLVLGQRCIMHVLDWDNELAAFRVSFAHPSLTSLHEILQGHRLRPKEAAPSPPPQIYVGGRTGEAFHITAH